MRKASSRALGSAGLGRLGEQDRRLRPLPGRHGRPAALVLAAFAVAIGLGTVLLDLPISSRNGHSVGLLDAFFTATSAVTVTGLAVVDTSAVFSPFGLGVILLLIQIGGLGIMTLAGFVGIVLSRRLRMTSQSRIMVEIGVDDATHLPTLIVNLMRFVLLGELLAGLLLTWRFHSLGYGWVGALGHGFFHAISAFNNAGFSTFDQSLAGEASDGFVLLVVSAAFIVGGLGFPVVFEIARGSLRPRTWLLHTKVTMAMTATLLTFGTALIALAEWNNPETLGSASFGGRFLHAFFQSATARTAGFNSVDIGALRPASLLLITGLMVIGAGSASTGGGIKVTTVAVVVRAMMAEFRQDKAVVVARRRIPNEINREALALVVAALLGVAAGAFGLALVAPDLAADALLFEAASAFGTAGLSTGITSDFGAAGRLLLCALMFVGRVGPITFGTAVLLRPRPRRIGAPDGNLLIG